MSYYTLMLSYLQTHISFCIELINRNRYLVHCILSLNPDELTKLLIEVHHKNNRKFTIIFDLNQYNNRKENDEKNEDVLKSIFEIIEKQSFCDSKFCNVVINNENEIINGICFRCAFYKDYKKEIDDSDCSICLEKNNINSIHLQCDHIFHKTCLNRSCDVSCLSHYATKCPLCRSELHFNNCMNQISNGQDCLDFME